MNKSQFSHLIKNVLAGSASQEEEEYVNKHFFDSSLAPKWDEEEMGKKEEIQTRLLSSIKREHSKKSKARKLSIKLAKVAAALTLFLMTGFYGHQNLLKESQTSIKSDQTLLPGKEIASLKIDDGTILNLDKLQIGEVIEKEGFSVVKTAEGYLEYQYRNTHDTKLTLKEELITLSTPKGGKFQIVLADGTKAWLNAESSVSFPKSFASNVRKVKVTGEVYFEVHPDRNKPFIVNAREMDIQVLGTSFNVSAYEDGLDPSISLVEGSVQVKTESSQSILSSGQQARISDKQIQVGDFDLESEIAWKDDYFIFKNRNIKEIMSDLARWYDAEVEYQGKGWEDKNFNIRISRRQNIEEILSIIELTDAVKFKIQGRRIVVVI